MKKLVLPVLALCATAALAQQVEPTSTSAPVDPEPPRDAPFEPDAENCEDRITAVRAANGQPKLERGTTSADDAQFIAAVDKRIDGCAVMVMRQDTSDIRPLPKPSDEVRIIKID